MSSFITLNHSDNFRDLGWCVIEDIIPDSNEIADSIIEETLQCLFSSPFEMKVIEELVRKDIDPLLLLTEPKLRKNYLDNPKCIWYNDNPRTPKHSKNTGMFNIYHNNLVRTKVLFNENIYNSINTLYEKLTGRKEDSIYLYGPDRVCVKAKGSTDMIYHIDCNLVVSPKTDYPSPPTSPLTMFRIQTICCLRIDEKEEYNGRTEILSGYNNYFLLGTKYFAKYFPLVKYKGGRDFTPLILQEVLPQYLPDFIDYIKSFYWEDTEELIPFEETNLEREVYDSLPIKRIEIEWLKPYVKAGDILCFDQRLPHRNIRNKSSIPRVATFVSLYPGSYLTKEDVPPIDLFEGKVLKLRETYANSLEREYFANMWEERVKFEKTPLVRRMLGLDKAKRKIRIITSKNST